MVGSIVTISVILVFLIVKHEKITKQKKYEKLTVYTLSAVTAGSSLLYWLPYSLSAPIIYLNKIIGSISEWVVG